MKPPPPAEFSSVPWTLLPPIPDTLHTLRPSQIHLWLLPLDQRPEILQACASVLSPDDLARSERLRFQHLRDRFNVARAALRQTLAAYLEAAPKALVFEYDSRGKPSLKPALNPAHITFNLSHSKALALLAVTRSRRIGVDLEHLEPRQDLLKIATRNFTPTEVAAIASLPEHRRTDAFYACWTLKEAYLKATGEGLSTPLDSFDVLFPPAHPAALGNVASSPGEHLRWQAWSLTLDRHAAAVLVEGTAHTIHRAVWNPQ